MRSLQALVLALVLAAPWAAGAQAVTDRFTVTPRGGFIHFDRASSLKSSGALSVNASYSITPMFAVGFDFAVSRPETRGEDFIAALRFGDPSAGDTTLFFQVEQPVSVINTALTGALRVPFEPFSLHATAGVGVYSLYLDPQVVGGTHHFSGMSGLVGAGVGYRLGQRVGVQLDVRDLIFTNYDRTRLNPTESRFANVRFREDFAPPPANKSSVHNLMLSLGFSFVPSRGATPEDEGTP